MRPELYRILSDIARRASLPIPRPDSDISSPEWVRFFLALQSHVS